MASLYVDTSISSNYRFRQQDGDVKLIETSTTVYVGNLSFYTTEEQIYELFSKCGDVKRIIMGLNKISKTPCGFCFVEYFTRPDTEDCVRYLNGARLDDRPIRVDIDVGFSENRQYGRGQSGGQVRDEMRTEFDAGRGGAPPPSAGLPFPFPRKHPRDERPPPPRERDGPSARPRERSPPRRR